MLILHEFKEPRRQGKEQTRKKRRKCQHSLTLKPSVHDSGRNSQKA